MRTPSLHPARLARALFAASFLVAAAGCGGGSGSSTLPNPGSNQICDPNAGAISIARPSPGFPQNGNSIEIVESTGQDQLHQFTGQFDLNLFDRATGQEIDTGFLTAVPDPSGPHPYSNDFYYAGTLSQNLLSGRTYDVYLNAPNTNCTRGLIGQIFT
ncbi:MAG: hypothetical protein QOJ39_951 [Candidatus Eremiobacteraeota bacterium]|nr:hypothetical protein [Candidatus Eremiobacteraeota bacterium]